MIMTSLNWEIFQTKEYTGFIWTKFKNQNFGNQKDIEVFYHKLGAITGSDMLHEIKNGFSVIYSIINQNEQILKLGDYVKCVKTSNVGIIKSFHENDLTIDCGTIVKYSDIELVSIVDLDQQIITLIQSL